VYEISLHKFKNKTITNNLTINKEKQPRYLPVDILIKEEIVFNKNFKKSPHRLGATQKTITEINKKTKLVTHINI
jgi:hypothetical protein